MVVGMLHCLLVLLLYGGGGIMAVQVGKIDSELQEIRKIVLVASGHERLLRQLLWPSHCSVVLHCHGKMTIE